MSGGWDSSWQKQSKKIKFAVVNWQLKSTKYLPFSHLSGKSSLCISRRSLLHTGASHEFGVGDLGGGAITYPRVSAKWRWRNSCRTDSEAAEFARSQKSNPDYQENAESRETSGSLGRALVSPEDMGWGFQMSFCKPQGDIWLPRQSRSHYQCNSTDKYPSLGTIGLVKTLVRDGRQYSFQLVSSPSIILSYFASFYCPMWFHTPI